jgi:glyoxylase-like metal-dependent hydrolase (beta-lactamase superfamily II)
LPAQIISGLYRLPGVARVNVYLWNPQEGARHDGAPLLFDCGWPWSGRGLVASLVALGVRPGTLDTIAVTHDDLDHVGRLAMLQAVSGARVVAHEIEAQRLALDTWRDLPVSLGPASLAVRLVEKRLRHWPHQAIRVEMPVRDGSLLPGGWVAVHTPGHTPGHTSYFHPETGVLMAGDAVCVGMTGGLRAPMPVFCENWAETARSIRKLAALEPQILCSGHGPVLYRAAEPLKQLAKKQRIS